MIGLEIAGKIVQLPDDVKISMSLNNPLFNDGDIIPGDWSLPFDVIHPDAAPENASTLDHVDVLESPAAVRKQDCRIFFDQVLWKTGKIVTQKIGNRVQMNFLGGLNTFPDFKTLKLRDLMNEQILIDATAITKKIYAKPLRVNDNYELIVNGKNYSSSAGTIAAALGDITGQIFADAEASIGTLEVVAIPFVENVAPTPKGLAAPYLVIRPGLRLNFEGFHFTQDSTDPLAPLSVKVDDNGVAPNYNWALEGDLGTYYAGFTSWLTPYLNGAYPTGKVRFPVLFNDGNSSDQATYKTGSFVNLSADGSITHNDPNATYNTLLRSSNTNSLQPFVPLKYLLQKAEAYFGITIEGDWITDPDTQAMLIYNSNPLDVPMEFVGGKKFIFWKRTFNLQSLVPDVTFIDLLKAFQNRYNLKIDLDITGKKLVIKKRETIAKNVHKDDISSKCSVVTSDGIEDQSLTGIRLQSDKESDDRYSTVDQIDIQTVEQTIPTDIASIRRVNIINGYSGILVSQALSDNFGIRIFYYKGIIENVTLGCAYPQADRDADAYTDQYADLFLKPGLYEYFWKYWIDQRIRRKAVNVLLDFDLADFMKLDWEQKKRFDRNDYFFNSIGLEMTNQGIRPAKATLYKC